MEKCIQCLILTLVLCDIARGDCKGSKSGGCIRNDRYTNVMFFTDGAHQAIYKMFRTTSAYMAMPVTKIGNPIALDIDPVENMLYWTDRTTRRIRRMDFDGDNDTIVCQLGGKSVLDGLSVDFITRLIFYTDTGDDVISVMTLDGKYRRNVIHTGLKEPRAVVNDFVEGVIFWTDWGTMKIERANYDGTERRSIVTTDVLWPNGLSLDRKRKHIYWCDGKLSKVERMDFNGHNRIILFHKVLDVAPQYFAIDVTEDYIYLTDWMNKEQIWRGTKDGKEYSWIGTPVFTRLNGLRAYQDVSLYTGNGCTKDNGGCSHFCFPKPLRLSRCYCPDGLRLAADKKQCIGQDSGNQEDLHIFVTDYEKKSMYKLNLETSDYRVIPALSYVEPTSMVFDNLFERIIWIDKGEGNLHSTTLTGRHEATITSNGDDASLEGLAIDPISRLIFITESKFDIIILFTIDERRSQVILEAEEDPWAIACDSTDGMIFWTSLGGKPKIQRANYDGTQKKTIVSEDLATPVALTIDIASKRLYWCDSTLSTIESIETSGLKRKVILSENRRQYMGLSYFAGHIYIADKSRRSVVKVDIHKKSLIEIGLPDLESPLGIHVASSTFSVENTNGCADNKGGCSHICLPKPKNKRACMCFKDYFLQNDVHCVKRKRDAVDATDDGNDDKKASVYNIDDITITARNLTNF